MLWAPNPFLIGTTPSRSRDDLEVEAVGVDLSRPAMEWNRFYVVLGKTPVFLRRSGFEQHFSFVAVQPRTIALFRATCFSKTESQPTFPLAASSSWTLPRADRPFRSRRLLRLEPHIRPRLGHEHLRYGCRIHPKASTAGQTRLAFTRSWTKSVFLAESDTLAAVKLLTIRPAFLVHHFFIMPK